MEANKKWLSIPEDFRKKLIGNVFSSNCTDMVTITDFVILDHFTGVMLDGKCKNCGNKDGKEPFDDSLLKDREERIRKALDGYLGIGIMRFLVD
ncbi:hypothetical protein [Halobacillus seohaensis]|uniref:Uncharacterized protein n=1 Tax=Halobacillus seohaensis TaxID=447421 RepID=A0ABW2EMS1_9BACI